MSTRLEYRPVADDRKDFSHRFRTLFRRFSIGGKFVIVFIVMGMIAAGAHTLYWRGYEAGFNAANATSGANTAALIDRIRQLEDRDG